MRYLISVLYDVTLPEVSADTAAAENATDPDSTRHRDTLTLFGSPSASNPDLPRRSLNKERIKRRIYAYRREVRSDVFDYIEAFYNRKRRHSHVDQMSPFASNHGSTLIGRFRVAPRALFITLIKLGV